jgi:lauroyl/myristoyl acyltransferase
MVCVAPLVDDAEVRQFVQDAVPEQDHRRIIADMSENLGRIAGEYPHSVRFATDPARMEIVGGEAIAALRDAGQPMPISWRC